MVFLRKKKASPGTSIDILVGTVTVIGTGLNLQRGYVMFLTEPQFLRYYTDQFVKRGHRMGVTHKVTLYLLSCRELKWESYFAHKNSTKELITDAITDTTRGDWEEAKSKRIEVVEV